MILKTLDSRLLSEQLDLAVEAAECGAPHGDQRPPEEDLGRLPVNVTM